MPSPGSPSHPLLLQVGQVLDEVAATRPEMGSLLLGVSGGPDSLALMDLLHQDGRFRLEVAHVDHGLRGEASGEDARFVAAHCAERHLPFHKLALSWDELGGRPTGNLQGRARMLRRRFFEQTRSTRQLDGIALGHTRDDQVETFFLHLVRGAGRRGLSGMSVLEGDLLRPLLRTPRKDILAYLEHRGLTPRQDPSNTSSRYARNRLRQDLGPALERIFVPGSDQDPAEAIARAMDVMAREDELLDGLADQALGDAVRHTDRGLLVDREAVLSSPAALHPRIFRRLMRQARGGPLWLSSRNLDDLIRLAREGVPGKRLLLRGLAVENRRKDLCIHVHCTAAVLPPEGGWELPVPGVLALHDLGLRFCSRRSTVGEAPVPGATPDQPQTTFLAGAEALEGTLRVRPVARGMRMAPLGMEGHTRLLSRILMDAGIPRDERARTLVLEDRAGILWLVGHRVAERARITASTREVLLVQAEAL